MAQRDAAQGALAGVVGDADPAVAREPSERLPAPQHVVDGLGEVVVAGQLLELLTHPGMETVNQRRAALAADGKSPVGAAAAHLALDVEQRIEPPHCFERDRLDCRDAFAPALLARGALEVGELEELASGMSLPLGRRASDQHPNNPRG